MLLFLSFYASFSDNTENAVAKLMSIYTSKYSGKNPTVIKSNRGYVKFLVAPEDGYFDLRGFQKGSSFESSKSFLHFVKENISAFTNLGESSDLMIKGVSKAAEKDTTKIRLGQKIGQFEVFGGEIVGKISRDGNLIAVSNGLLEDLSDGEIALFQSSSVIPIEKAKQSARVFFEKRLEDKGSAVKSVCLDSSMYIFSPGMLKMPGATTIVYVGDIITTKAETYRVLIDAFTGEIRLWYPLKYGILYREVYDASNPYDIPNSTVRKEGDPPVGIQDVDNVYDYLGDAYSYFFNYHLIDSYDDNGSAITAWVRFPEESAYYDPTRKLFVFGVGVVADDVVGHEYAHAVVDSFSDLVYFGEPGAIIESLCDIWGEFIDLTNERGLDTPEVRWLIGEELPPLTSWEGSGVSAIRSLADPTLYNQPDKYTSEYFVRVSSLDMEDYGAVHTNSGVGNKLGYLLAEGGNFNGERVEPLGIPLTSKILFSALDLLPPLADYKMFALALNAGAIIQSQEQNFSDEERERVVKNVKAALRAVEIYPLELELLSKMSFRATYLGNISTPGILLTWYIPPGLYEEALIIKSSTGFPRDTTDGDEIFRITRDTVTYFLDTDVIQGYEYFYTVFVKMYYYADQFIYVDMSDSAVVGKSPPPVLTQEFKRTGSSGSIAEDLQYSQITFIPTGSPINPLNDNRFLGSYNKYDAIFQPNVFSFPVKKYDLESPVPYIVNIANDGLFNYSFVDAEFPFFGRRFGTIYIAANGYISFAPVALKETDNFPSLESHFSVPRISFLFSDLAPEMGGEIWLKRLKDRLVVTFERVPRNYYGEPPNPYPENSPGSSVQVELFFSGHIRITYLELNPNYTIVGLSDGRGIPVDPATIIPGIPSLNRYVDFTTLPSQSSVLSINPLPVFDVLPNTQLQFEVSSNYVGNSIPNLYAQWLRSEMPPFSDLRNGSGKFSWIPTLTDTGTYYLRIIAQQGDQFAYQDVRINVNPVEVKPQALNLRISSLSPAEDTSATRMVSAGRPLIASYDYVHPLMTTDPAKYAEGLSILYWFRNHEVVSALTNYRTVPANVTKGGDIWYFRVIPVTISGLFGEEVMSPVIYVVDNPTIAQVVPNRGKTTGGEPVRLRGKGFVGILTIKFGGVPVVSYKAITEEEIEVITPQHQAGLVDIYIKTVGGFTNLPQAFEYYEEEQPTPEKPSEKNNQILWCGSSNTGANISAFSFFDLLFVLLVLLLVQVGSKKGHYLGKL